MENNRPKSQHVSIYLPTLTPGGIERAMINLAEGLLRKGLEIDVVTADGHGEFRSQLPQGTEFINLQAGRVLKSLPSLTSYLRSEQPDYILSGHTHANIVSVAATALSGGCTENIISVQSPRSRAYRNTKSIKSSVIKKLFPTAYRRAASVVAVSEGIAEDLINNWGIDPDLVTVIYNPVVTDTLYKKAEESVSHPWLDDPSTKVVMSAGRLSPVKDYTTLIRAFKKINNRRSDTRLIIAGSGDEKQNLQKTINKLDLSEYAELIGYVDNPYAYMRQADVFTLTSKWEGLGNVLVESMAVGTPVVSTDCPTGPREVLQDGNYGRLVPTDEEDMIANSICDMLDDPIRPEYLHERSNDFRVEKISGEYLSLLNSS